MKKFVMLLILVVGVAGCQTTSKKLTYKPTTPVESGISLNIDGYKTRYTTKGWNETYTRKYHRASIHELLPSSGGSLYLRVWSIELERGRFWVGGKTEIKSLIRKYSRFKNHIVRFTEIVGKTKGYDSSKREAAAKFELSHPIFKFCYFIKYIPNFGDGNIRTHFSPNITATICTPTDLNLSIKNPEKFFIIDNAKEKVILDSSYQNLGKKLSSLRATTPSTLGKAAERRSTTSEKISSSIKTEKRPIALQWQGKNQLIIGTVEIPLRGKVGKMTLTLPNNKGACSGTFSFKNRSSGAWAAACTNGETVSGAFRRSSGGSGFIGNGTDNLRRKVKFTIGAR